MVDDVDGAISEVNGGIVAMGYYTSVLVVFNADRKALDTSVRRVTKEIAELGFTARVEDTNTLDAYFGSLPGHCDENVRRPLMNTLNLGDLLPTSSIWTGEAQAPCPFYPALSPALMSCLSTGNAPFWLNLHVRDIGHTVMFGPTGAGKSTHLAMLAAQLRRYRDMAIFFFDKGHSIYPLAMAAGGEHYTVGGDGDELAFCPLQYLETKADRAWAAEWIETVLGLNQIQISSVQRNEIVAALENMHASGARTLTDFTITIQDQAIREGLKQYTVAGSMGHLLDAERDGLALSDFTCFEIEELLNLGEKYALPVLLYLFRRIERSLRGQPAAIVLDEAWIMLGHPVFREKIREWLKVMRKANCLILMATQSLSDAANSGILDVIVESTATKIFLPNPYAREVDAAALYRRMGLNERQIQLLAEAIPKREYYYVSERGRRLYELSLGAVGPRVRGRQRPGIRRHHPPVGRPLRTPGLGEPLARAPGRGTPAAHTGTRRLPPFGSSPFGVSLRSPCLRRPRMKTQAPPATTNGSTVGSPPNPYLNARRHWNDHVGQVVTAAKVWQAVAIGSLAVAALEPLPKETW